MKEQQQKADQKAGGRQNAERGQGYGTNEQVQAVLSQMTATQQQWFMDPGTGNPFSPDKSNPKRMIMERQMRGVLTPLWLKVFFQDTVGIGLLVEDVKSPDTTGPGGLIGTPDLRKSAVAYNSRGMAKWGTMVRELRLYIAPEVNSSLPADWQVNEDDASIDENLAVAVAAWQGAHDLKKVDGKVGPETRKALAGQGFSSVREMTGGTRRYVYNPLIKNAKKRKDAISYNNDHLRGMEVIIPDLKKFLAGGGVNPGLAKAADPKKGIPDLSIQGFDPSIDENFVTALAQWQGIHNLTMDGKLGLNTSKALDRHGFVTLPELNKAAAQYKKFKGPVQMNPDSPLGLLESAIGDLMHFIGMNKTAEDLKKQAEKDKKDTRDITYNDMNQNQLGDCWLLSALSSVAATHPEVIHDAIKILTGGIYQVKLFRPKINWSWGYPKITGIHKAPVYLRVRSILPADKNGNPTNMDMNLMDKKPDGGVELWMPILVQAFAKFFDQYEKEFNPDKRGYERLGGGWAQLSLSILTGKVPKVSHILIKDHGPDSEDPDTQPVTIGTMPPQEMVKKNKAQISAYLASQYSLKDLLLALNNEIKTNGQVKTHTITATTFSDVMNSANMQIYRDEFPVHKLPPTLRMVLKWVFGMVTSHEESLLHVDKAKRLWKIRNPWGSNPMPNDPNKVVFKASEVGQPVKKDDDAGVYWMHEKDIPRFFSEVTSVKL